MSNKDPTTNEVPVEEPKDKKTKKSSKKKDPKDQTNPVDAEEKKKKKSSRKKDATDEPVANGDDASKPEKEKKKKETKQTEDPEKKSKRSHKKRDKGSEAQEGDGEEKKSKKSHKKKDKSEDTKDGEKEEKKTKKSRKKDTDVDGEEKKSRKNRKKKDKEGEAGKEEAGTEEKPKKKSSRKDKGSTDEKGKKKSSKKDKTKAEGSTKEEKPKETPKGEPKKPEEPPKKPEEPPKKPEEPPKKPEEPPKKPEEPPKKPEEPPKKPDEPKAPATIKDTVKPKNKVIVAISDEDYSYSDSEKPTPTPAPQEPPKEAPKAQAPAKPALEESSDGVLEDDEPEPKAAQPPKPAPKPPIQIDESSDGVLEDDEPKAPEQPKPIPKPAPKPALEESSDGILEDDEPKAPEAPKAQAPAKPALEESSDGILEDDEPEPKAAEPPKPAPKPAQIDESSDGVLEENEPKTPPQPKPIPRIAIQIEESSDGVLDDDESTQQTIEPAKTNSKPVFQIDDEYSSDGIVNEEPNKQPTSSQPTKVHHIDSDEEYDYSDEEAHKHLTPTLASLHPDDYSSDEVISPKSQRDISRDTSQHALDLLSEDTHAVKITYLPDTFFDKSLFTTDRILVVSKADKNVVLMNESKKILVSEEPFHMFTECELPHSDEPITYICLSPNGKYLLAGHESGNLTVFDFEKRQRIKQIKRKSQFKVFQTGWACDSNSFFCVDDNNIISIYVIVNHKSFTFKEKKTLQLNDEIIDMTLAVPNSNMFIVHTVTGLKSINYETGVIRDLINDGFVLTEMTHIGENHHLATAQKTYFQLFSVDRDGLCPLMIDHEFPTPIVKMLPFDNGVLCLIFADFSLTLVTTYGEIGEIFTLNSLKAALKDMKAIFTHNQRVYNVRSTSTVEIAFQEWNAILKGYAEDKKFIEAFNLAEGIYNGYNLSQFGLPEDPKERKLAVQKEMEPIIHMALATEDISILKYIFKVLAQIEMIPMIIGSVQPKYEKMRKLDVFYLTLLDDECRDVFGIVDNRMFNDIITLFIKALLADRPIVIL